MKTLFLSIALIFVLGWSNAQPGSISNIQVSQGTGEYQRVVNILFDLSGGDPLYYISLEISFDNGISYNPVDPNEVSGSLTVSPGMGIHLLWDGRLSYPTFTSDWSRLKIIATTWQCGNPITDSRDGQIYNTVLIGSQCWMAENLNAGAMVASPLPLNNNGIIEKYCYDNLTENCDVYGGLYTWDEAINYNAMGDPHGICPDGWHIPTDEEWKQLEGEADSFIDYPDPVWNNFDGRGVDAGANLKEAGNTHWAEPNVATNSTGLSLMPGGGFYSSTQFLELHYFGHYWSSTLYDMESALYRAYDYNGGASRRYYFPKYTGMSIRCLQDAETVEPPPTWSCGDPINDTRDNQNYSTVQIAGQCWMAENLNIGIKLDSTISPSNNGVIEKHCYHDQDSYCGIYGGLYPWMEMMQYSNAEGSQGICPDGWHLPTWNEWWDMINYVGENGGGESGEPGGKLKEAGYEHWMEPNAGATNESGFTALPGGRFLPGNAYSFLDYDAKFWSSREFYPTTRAGSFSLSYDSESIISSSVTNKLNEFSVRCIKGQGASGNEE